VCRRDPVVDLDHAAIEDNDRFPLAELGQVLPCPADMEQREAVTWRLPVARRRLLNVSDQRERRVVSVASCRSSSTTVYLRHVSPVEVVEKMRT